MKRSLYRWSLSAFGAFLALAVTAAPAAAQNDDKPDAKKIAEFLAQRAKALEAISQPGPMVADLGVSQVQVPEGYRFVGKTNIRKFNDIHRELTGPKEVGAIFPADGGWYVIFSYHDDGYVKDDEKSELVTQKAADDLLASLREGQEEGNRERRARNMEELVLRGWEKPPFFDDTTKNLTWALQVGTKGQQGYGINYDARILGRGGYTSANLVIGQEELAETIPVYNKILAGFSYKDGQKYSEWKAGDKVAAIGLTGLIAGGAGVLAGKAGLFGKFFAVLAKGGKAVVAVFAALIAGVVGIFKKMFGRSTE